MASDKFCPNSRGGISAKCRECTYNGQKEYYSTEKGIRSRKNTELKKHYNITLIQYEEILKNQNGVCAICENAPSDNRMLSVDHNHTTGAIRSLLCGNCNTGIGHFREDIELFNKAINYLKKMGNV